MFEKWVFVNPELHQSYFGEVVGVLTYLIKRLLLSWEDRIHACEHYIYITLMPDLHEDATSQVGSGGRA